MADYPVTRMAGHGKVTATIRLVAANDNKMPVAYRCGVQAKRIGMKLSENPFHMLDHPEAWKQWRDGWSSTRGPEK
jgi:hypothetical protein